MRLSSAIVSTSVGFSCWWARRRYFIEGDYILPIFGSAIEKYEVFAQSDEQPLVKALVTLNTGNNRAVEEFIGQWGLLGLHDAPLLVTPHLGDEQPTPKDVNTVKVWDGTRYRDRGLWNHSHRYFPYLEKIPGFEWYILTPARWNYMAEPLMEFQQTVKEFKQMFSRCVEWRKRGDDDSGKELNSQVVSHLHHIPLAPSFGPVGAGGDRWTVSWFCPCPLTAAYAMLLPYLSDNPNVRLCARKACGRPFDSDRPGRIFCSKRCQSTQKQAEYRQQLKKRQPNP